MNQLAIPYEEERKSHVRLTKTPTIEQLIQDPFHAIASDYDGVVELHTNRKIASVIRPLFIEKTLKKGLPLAFITGKEQEDAVKEIINPFRRDIEALGIELEPNQFMVYTNNGSVVIDAGLENQVIEQKRFSAEQLSTITESEAVQALLDIYKLIEDQRDQLGSIRIDQDATHFRQRDLSTICFRIDPEDLAKKGGALPILSMLRQAGGKVTPTRFDIAQKIKAELATLGLKDAVVSATDRSIDITPPGSGKRQALEDFARRTGIAPDKMLRMGDSPTGMDFGLLSALEGESRGGFTNVQLNNQQLQVIQSDPEHSQSLPPIEIGMKGDQFQQIIWLMENVTTLSQSASSWS